MMDAAIDVATDRAARERPGGPPRTLLITCGALAREVLALIEANGWRHFELTAIPAILHNRPERIADAVREKIAAADGDFERVLVLYGDCGTGGGLDAMLAAAGVERIPGPHCYSFYAGRAVFEALAEARPGTFYLTDYLARHFDSLIVRGLGLDRHPELRDDYFANYTDLVYLAQSEDAGLEAGAREAARRLGLAYSHRYTGFGELGDFLDRATIESAADG
jgi:hypothetical protein